MSFPSSQSQIWDGRYERLLQSQVWDSVVETGQWEVGNVAVLILKVA